jgi:hypothetical protein
MSTLQAPYKLINNILLALNNKLTIGGVFCGLEKVFDGMNRDILLLKLGFDRIVIKAYTVIKSYLNDRYQKVLIDHRYTVVFLQTGQKLNTASLGVQYLVLCFFFSI